jgi:hypothetical protein
MHVRALRRSGLGGGLAALALALLPAAAARAQAPAIEHKAVSCIVAERFPRLDACFVPNEQVARARVHFRTHGTRHWYFVDMGAEGPCHSGVLPRPRKSTKKIDYYIDVVDRRFAEGRTQEHDPRVVARSGECGRDMMMAASLGSAASIVLGVAAGAPPIPVGFESAGIAGVPGPGSPVAGAEGGGGGGVAAAFIIGAAAAGGAAYYLTQQDEEAAAGPAYDGAWAGTTSQNRGFTFTVAQNAVISLDTSSVLSGTSAPIPIQRSFSPGLPIANGSFSIQEQGLVLTGTFASEEAASGRLEPTRVSATWQATRR